jgi:hypothetical protein
VGCPGLIPEFVEKKKRVLGFKILGFLGDGFGVKEKKRQARVDCVRPSRAPTSVSNGDHLKFELCRNRRSPKKSPSKAV